MLDRVFRIFGLHGNSVMAYVISGGIAGGCAVPGVMAARTLRSSRERLATLLTAPFMNCGAKLPVLAMLIAAFFPARRAQLMFLLTLLSWSMALLLAKLLRSTILRGPSTPFLLELPPYRLPTFKGLLIHTWERTWQYIRKAGTIILAISILFWALMAYPELPAELQERFRESRQEILSQLPEELRETLDQAPEPDPTLPEGFEQALAALHALDQEEAEAALQYSIAGRLGLALETVTRWSGFDWRTNLALLSGFAAKELILSTMGTAYSMGRSRQAEDLSLSEQLAQDSRWNRTRALALIVFIMLYAPCLPTVVCIVREAGAWKWGLFSLAFNTTVAFLAAVLIFLGGSWLGSRNW